MSLYDGLNNGVLVEQKRYDELLHKEALLSTIKTLCDKMSDYAVRDAIVHLLKTEVKSDG